MPLPPPSPSAKPSRTASGMWVGLLWGAIAAAYAPSLQAPFVYDDTLAIPENPSIRRLWPLTDVLVPQNEGGLTVSGRPVLNVSFAINYAISGTGVWSYHVFNLLVHAAAATTLLGIVRRTGRTGDRCPSTANALALAIAGVWGLHPLLTQAVTYTVQRAESLMGLFYLLTIYTTVRVARAQETDSAARARRWMGLGWAACLLGMGTKEVMATAPMAALLFDRTFLAGSFGAAWRRRRGYYLGLAATWIVLATLVASTGGNRGGTVGLGVGIPLSAYPLTQFKAIACYLGLAVWPHPLVFEYGTFWVKNARDVLPYAALVGPLLLFTIVALRRAPVAGFFGAWFLFILAPTSLAPGTIQMIVEHRAYLPLAGLVAAAVLAAHRLLGAYSFPGFGVLALALGLTTLQRNQDYRSHLALWSDTVAKRPDNPRAHDGLAEAYAEIGRLGQALEHRRTAVRLLPDEATYHYNLAMSLAETGQLDEAVRHYKISLQLKPDEPRTHNNLAILLGQRGDDAGALAHYAMTVRLRPDNPLFHYNHGIALLRAGRPADAAASFEHAVTLRRDYADAHFNLGTALVRLRQVEKALAHYVTALQLRPEDPEYRTTYAGALLLAQRPGDALAEFQRVLARDPESVDARFGTGNAHAALRQWPAAIADYEAVLRSAPNHANAHFKLANALLDADRVADAITHYRAAVRLAPDDAEAHHNLGIAHARREEWIDARREFETALRLKPGYPDALRHLEQLKAVMGR